MNLNRILNEMYKERAALAASIEALERFMASSRRRRGRRPKWLEDAERLAASSISGKKTLPTKWGSGS